MYEVKYTKSVKLLACLWFVHTIVWSALFLHRDNSYNDDDGDGNGDADDEN